ncbi:ferredoxin [bacterium]|jgi:ferredoxin|nr:ferredoxin [bacterium]
MADFLLKHYENNTGLYFVDQSCIACDTCTGIAPNSFTLTEDKDHAYVAVQPIHAHELTQCEDALFACPVNAIGKKGTHD